MAHNHNHSLITRLNRAFLIAVVLNALFVILQIVFSFIAHSTSLFADAIHNFGDVLGIGVAGVGNYLLKKGPTDTSTYGLKKTSILASLANGLLLVFSSGIIATEAIYKLISPTGVHAGLVILIAGIGIIINGGTALLFLNDTEDLNVRGAFLHLLYDAFISLSVVVSALLLYLTGWLWLDPLMSLIIALVILRGTWDLFIESFRLLMDAVPEGIDISKVEKLLLAQPGVTEIHDLHIWAMSTRENALSAHLIMPSNPLTDEALSLLTKQLTNDHGIHHVTLQVERQKLACSLYCPKA